MYLSFLLAGVCLPVQIQDGSRQSRDDRPLYDVNREVSALCKRDSFAKSDQEKASIAYEMTLLYREILDDPRYLTSESLQEYRARLWSRLTRTKKDVQARLKRESKSDRTAEGLSDAQRAMAAATTQALGDQFSMMSASLGGPAGVFHMGAAGGRVGPPDYGPDLVDLIQRTIQPEFWDVNGGPGTIVYYRPLHCLVVRATSEIHHRLGGTIGDLRAAGK